MARSVLRHSLWMRVEPTPRARCVPRDLEAADTVSRGSAQLGGTGVERSVERPSCGTYRGSFCLRGWFF